MCGITGKIYFKKQKAVENTVLSKMCNSLIHRGPDEKGYYLKENVGLGMRRLSIIDLKGGKQPIHNEDKTVWVVLNGEIYNFQEIKQKLQKKGHKFYTRSDTEVIVHLYEEYGIDFPTHIEGMFAIALWDEKEKCLFLVRDRMGIKPLYYAELPDRFLFGSEIKAIREDDPKLSLDPQALSYYLSLLYIPAPNTIYKEIRKLEPGKILILRNSQVAIRSYWNLNEVKPLSGKISTSGLKQELRNLFLGSVKSQLISDVPIGFFLSGGIDSSIVAACASQVHNGRLKTFSIGFDDPSYDETEYAETVADYLGTDHTKINVKPDAKNLIEKLVYHFDEPFADSSAIPTYYLSEMTRKHVKVALSGDGGDELFAGYLTYQADKLARFYNLLPGILTRKVFPSVVNHLPVSDSRINFGFKARQFTRHALLEPGERHFAWKAFFDDEFKRSLLSNEMLSVTDKYLDGYLPYKRYYEEVPHFDAISRFQYADTKVYLIDNNLVKVDRMSMANSLEVRVPFLDTKIVEFAFKLPGGLKMPGLSLKHFLRQSVKELLPSKILNRSKKGFNVPMSGWLKNELRPYLLDILSENTIKKQGYFNSSAVNFLIESHLNGKADYSRNLWALLIFNLWAKHSKM